VCVFQMVGYMDSPKQDTEWDRSGHGNANRKGVKRDEV